MPQPKSLASYKDCEEHFEKALNSSRGILVTLDTPGAAKHFIQRMNSYRSLLRKQSMEIYPPEHPSHNTTIYDTYKLSVDVNNVNKVFIKPYDMKTQVEEL